MPIKGEDDHKPVCPPFYLKTEADKQKRFNAAVRDPLLSHPTKTAALLISDVLQSSLPVNLIPGPSDPAGSTLPQQPLPKIMFGGKSKTEGLESMTNPSWMEIGERRWVSYEDLERQMLTPSFLGTGGQTIDDIFKYLPSNSRLAMARRTLEWRHIAPTAPDTLCKLSTSSSSLSRI